VQTATGFTGFGERALDWFDGLEEDNSKSYFEAHRTVYEQDVRRPLEALLTELAADFGGAAYLFRPYRDVRFTHDKSPYKTNAAGHLRGREGTGAGLYVSLSGAGLYAGSGYWGMARDQQQRLVEAVADERSGQELVALVAAAEEAGLTIWGQELKTAPRGYTRDHPRIRFLRHKHLNTGANLDDPAALTSRAALDHTVRAWRAGADVNAWLDRHVGPSNLPEDARGRRRG
jgi:uncharacterized protein (TIGR02453 family)